MHVCRQMYIYIYIYSVTSDTADTVLSFNNAHEIMRHVDSRDRIRGNIVSLFY